MENIFSALFFGKIIPHEQFVPKTEEYQKACKRYIHACTKLEKEMEGKAPSLVPRFKEAEDEYMEIGRLEQAAAFELGFRLGVRLVAESYRKDITRKEKKIEKILKADRKKGPPTQGAMSKKRFSKKPF